MKYTRHYDRCQDYVTHYTTDNGYVIKGNAGRDIFSSRVIPSDFWYVYDKDGNQVFCDHLLKRCKEFVESIEAESDTEDQILETACEKLGQIGCNYLEDCSERMNNLYDNGNDRLAVKNEGRIVGYLRALEHLGKFTPEEMKALKDRFLL